MILPSGQIYKLEVQVKIMTVPRVVLSDTSKKNIHAKKINFSCGRLQIRDNTKTIKKPHYKSLLKIGIQIKYYHN